MSSATVSSGVNFEDFSGTLAKEQDSTLEYENSTGACSIGVYVGVPTDGVVVFEGRYDDSNWTSITLRNVDSDDNYTNKTSTSGNFIGSILSLKAIRFRTSVAGSADGEISGRVSVQSPTIKGIEHGFPVHKRGVSFIRTSGSYSTTQTDTVIWTPASGKKIVITDYLISISNSTLSSHTVTFFEDTNSSTNYIFVDYNGSGDAKTISTALVSPMILGTDNSLKLTTSGAVKVSYVINGFEIW